MKFWMKLAGLVILLVMVAVTTFSLGVYVGERGWMRAGQNGGMAGGQPFNPGGPAARPPVNGPGFSPQGGNSPAMPPGAAPTFQPQQPRGMDANQPVLPQGVPALTGKVARINAQTAEIASAKGVFQIRWNATTRFEASDGTTASAKLAVGDIIAVFGKTSGGNSYTADLIVLLPPPW